MRILFSSLILLSWIPWNLCQRNAEAEGYCQPFLTSPKTSPLIDNLPRNIRLDEDGEFYCELVLQDRYLPPQIRVTIHEGLAYLAIRHVQLGLQRHRTIIRHFKILCEILPTSFRFNSKAGSWSLDPNILNVEDAIHYLTNALYHNASKDNEATNGLKLHVRRDLARAYTMHGDFILAQKEYYQLLQQTPTDFGLAFHLRQVTAQIPETAGLPREDVDDLLKRTDILYSEITQHASNNYTGFIPSETWHPEEFQTLPTLDQFLTFVRQRTPFLVRGSTLNLENSVDSLKALLNWETSSWINDPTYLINQVNHDKDPDDDDLTVLVERRKRQIVSNRNDLFGFGVNVHNVHLPFVEFLENYYCSNNENISSKCKKKNKIDVEWVEYLNVQDLRDSNGSIWRPPLSLPSLKRDIPIPSFLQQFLDEGTLTDINLWMGNTHENQGRATTSRLHMDALDNFYVLISGNKKFRIISPNYAPILRTISPTYAVLNNGFSFQYSFMTPLSEEQKESLLATSSMTDVGGDNSIINQLITGESYEYDTNTVKFYHFSSVDDIQDIDEIKNNIIEITLNPGDLFYLPAGWFHQVTSSGGQHMAINYWWKPPDWKQTLEEEKRLKYQLLSDIKEKLQTRFKDQHHHHNQHPDQEL